MKILIVNYQGGKWCDVIRHCNNCICIDESSLDNYNKQNYKLLPIFIDEFVKYNHIENNIFRNTLENIHLLNNKGKFAKYMLTYFPENIPLTYYYNFDNEYFINISTNNNDIINENNNTSYSLHDKMIIKPIEEMGGKGVQIIHTFENNIKMNYIIQQYIEHVEYYAGHFLVFTGVIYNKVFFMSSEKNREGIKCGAITNYKISNELSVDDTIFRTIFTNLNYSGICCVDFTIKNDKIIIFEINPRPGGSLLLNETYFNHFVDTLLENI